MIRSQRTFKPLKMPILYEKTLEEENTPPGYQAVGNHFYGLEYAKGVKKEVSKQQIQKSIKERVEMARERYRRIQRNESSYKVYLVPVQQQLVFHNTQYNTGNFEQPTYVERPQGLITPDPEDQESCYQKPVPQSCSTNYIPNPHMLTPSPESVHLPGQAATFASQPSTVVNGADKYRRNRAQHQLQRYHSMTPEQKRQYNQRRIEQCRRRREEDQSILAEAAKANATPEILAKAEEVLTRKRKNEERSERMKYNKMMDAQRKKENGTNC